MLNNALFKIASLQTKPRIILGLMSGTSLDGLDIALCQIDGHDLNTKLEVKAFESVPYTSEFLSKVSPVFANPQATLETITCINAWIAREHASMVLDTLSAWGVPPQQIDVLASHGQTIFHAPNSFYVESLERKVSATIQVGDGCHLAHLTQILTLSDFRQKHVAANAEGAPLVPYADFLLFMHHQENRILLNIGGIANYTLLPAGSSFKNVVSADTGPGNTLIDNTIAYAKELQDNNQLSSCFPLISQRFDENGKFAAQGRVDPLLLSSLERAAINANGEKAGNSTGQETYNRGFIDCAMHNSTSPTLSKFPVTEQEFYDLLATLTMFTAKSISSALNKLIATINNPYTSVVYISGGGVHNDTLLDNIQTLMPKLVVKTSNVLGIAPDAKEAALFAVLANQTLFGGSEIFDNNSEMPSICFGKISLP